MTHKGRWCQVEQLTNLMPLKRQHLQHCCRCIKKITKIELSQNNKQNKRKTSPLSWALQLKCFSKQGGFQYQEKFSSLYPCLCQSLFLLSLPGQVNSVYVSYLESGKVNQANPTSPGAGPTAGHTASPTIHSLAGLGSPSLNLSVFLQYHSKTKKKQPTQTVQNCK